MARIYAARARLEAVHLNRLGEYRDARRALRGVARGIADYAGSDTELKDLAANLVAEGATFSAPMAELDRTAAISAPPTSSACAIRVGRRSGS